MNEQPGRACDAVVAILDSHGHVDRNVSTTLVLPATE